MTTERATRASAERWGVLPWRGIGRQSRGDAAALAVGMAVVAAAAFLSAAVPQAMDAVATAELRTALGAKGVPAAVVVTVPITDSVYQLDLDTVDAAAFVKDQVDAGMPGELRQVLAAPVTALEGPELKAGAIAERPGRVRFIYVASVSGPRLDWIEGRAPESSGDAAGLPEDGVAPPVEVAVSEAGAALMGVHAGAHLAVDDPNGQPLTVRLSGIYRAADPGDDAWSVAPTLLKPRVVGGSAAVASVGLLVSEQSLPFAQVAVYPSVMTRSFTYRAIPTALDGRRAGEVASQARGLASGRKVFEGPAAGAIVTTQLDRVIENALARVAAATSQASVLLIGLLSVAVLVELLAAALVVERRASVLTQWRSRGASLPAIGMANAAESTLLAGVAGAVGLVAAGLAVGGVPPWGWIVPPLLAAALAQPVLAMRAAGRATRPVRPSPPRRGALTSAHVRRLGAELTLAAVALGALATLVVRGVNAAAGAVWSDVVVLAAPVLVALALSLALVRVVPRLSTAAREVAARGRGVVALLAAARTRANGVATAALLTAALMATIAASVAGTVRLGQQEASWDAVGADAAATTGEPAGLPLAVAGLDGTGGLRAATATVISGAQAIGSGLDKAVVIVAVDADAMGRLLAASPAPDAPALSLLGTDQASDLPVLVTGGQSWDGATLRWGDDVVRVRTVGEAPALPGSLALQRFVVVVDRRHLAAAVGHEVPATDAWVVGAGAEAGLTAALAGTDAAVVTRQGWLEDRAADPVTQALGWLFPGAGVAAIVLAALAVVLMAASASAERTRAGALLRVVGTPGAAAARVAWLEATVPAVAVSAVGIACGIGLADLLVVALDLTSITGGRQAPSLVIAWWSLAIPLALGAVARIAVVALARGHRDEQLGPVLRVAA